MLSAQQLMAAFAPHGLLEPVQWTPRVGQSAMVNGKFRVPFAEVLDVGATAPMFEAAAADLPGVAPGDVVTFAATSYKVITVKPDSKGFVVLTLQAP